MFENWEREISISLRKSDSIYIALFNESGQLIDSNSAFNELNRKIVNPSILNPSFEALLESTKNSIFEGIVTIGNINSLNTSFKSKVYQKKEQILFVGEIDSKNISKQNISLAELNRTNSNLRRELIKEKKLLEIANNKLELLNKNQNLLLGTAAHDLRNPMGTAFSFSDFLISNFSDFTKDEILNYLELIKSNTNYSLELLESLLDLSTIKSGLIILKKNKKDYIEVIKQSISTNSLVANKKNISICFTSILKQCVLEIDSIRISQVLNNLISNAIKFSHSESTITIALVKNKNSYITKVIDEGQGININELDHIFAPFQTSSTKSTANEKSTGLGLSIVKKVIEMHKGELKVESKKGIGTTFSFTLPSSD